MSKTDSVRRTRLANRLLNNPAVVTTLWALALLAFEVGTVVADSAGSTTGP